MHSTPLLNEARRIFLKLRTLPLDVAHRLMECGFDVDELEASWEREFPLEGVE